MIKQEFTGLFRFLDYRMSHKLLLIRGSEIINEENINIDLIFDGVFYIEAPETFEDLTVYDAPDDIKITEVRDRISYQVNVPYEKIFILESGSNKYYIGARKLTTKKNKLPPLESSLEK